MRASFDKQHPDIDYPTDWQYKLVGREEAAMRRAVEAELGERPYQLALSNRSRKGNYLSINLELEVTSEQDRLAIFNALGAADSILYVL